MIKGIGIDSIEQDRICRILCKYGHRFLDRILGPEEKKEIEIKSNQFQKVRYLSNNFACKEALSKALGLGLAGGGGRFGHGNTFYSQQLEMSPWRSSCCASCPPPAFQKSTRPCSCYRTGGSGRTVRFGTASNYVSNPRKTARDRAAYIARHRVNENHNDPLTPGALSRWLLWGESRSLARNTAAFRRRFRLQ